MPHHVWSYPCCPDRERGPSGSETCPDCGAPGVPAGWGYSLIERMAIYQRTFAVCAIGPHRELTHELLGKLRSNCRRCNETGIVGIVGRMCPTCEGGGGAWTVPDSVLAVLYREVLRQFPDAARPGGLTRFMDVAASDGGQGRGS